MKTRLSIASFGLASLVSSAVQAVILPSNGSQVALPGTSVAAQPQLAGIVVADVVTPFSYVIHDDLCGESCGYSYFAAQNSLDDLSG